MKLSENVTEKNKKKELEQLLQIRAEELRQHKREQQIALALERVQEKALAMHDSRDISETTALFFHELNRLGIEMERCGIVIFNDTPVLEVWSTPLTPEENQINKVVTGKLDSRIHPMLQGVYGAWQKGKKYFFYTLKGDEVKKYYEKLNQVPEYQFPETHKYPDIQIDNCFYFNDGHLFVYTKSPLTEEVKKIFHRFTKMFSLAYTRYLDIKKAEEQAREAQIAAALERVRASSNGMQKSDELANVIVLLDAELHKLGVNQSNSVLMTDWDIDNLEAGACLWLGVAGQKYLHKYHVPFNKEYQIDANYLKARKKNVTFYTESYTKAEKNKYFRYHFKNGELGQIPEDRQKFMLDTKGYSRAVVSMKNSGLFVQRYSDEPFTKEQLKIIERFGNVFEQTYTRFLDLQKAEKQAHEAEIEASLERVRAKAMAMRSSKDISDATAVVFNELSKLGIEMDRCGIATYTDTPIMKVWSTPLSPENKQVIKVVHGDLDYRFNSLLIEVREAWENKQEFFTRTYEGDEVTEYYTHLLEAPDYHFPIADEYPEKHVASMCYFKQGFIFIWTQFELTEHVKGILKRFTKEFSGTYTRYLDLKKAEAQARESQIEATLERVRAKAMAMHSSKDISGATVVIFNELKRLGIKMIRAGVVIFNETPVGEVWSTRISPKDNQVIDIVTGSLDFHIHPMLHNWYRAWKNGKDYYNYELTGDDIRKYYELLGGQPEYHFPKTEKYPDRQIANSFYQNEINIFAYTSEPLTDEVKQIFQRFTKVFSHTYKRYLDIIKAETQAREAQVEASLERVRAKALAMHSSEDISDATAIVFNELTRLGIDMVRAGIVILNKNSFLSEVWSTRLSPKDKHVTNIVTGFLNYEIHPMLQEAYRSWKNEEPYTTYELKGMEVREYYELLAKQPRYNFPKTDKYPERQILNGSNFNGGHIFAYTEEKLTKEEKQILSRFAKVFSHTYRRYQDLIKAEAQAREAQVEASLERVRAKAMAMRSSKDISGATAIVFNELTRLGVKMERCGISIFNNPPTIEIWSTPLSKKNKQVVKVLTGKINSNIHPMLQKSSQAWKNKDDFFSYELKGDEVKKYYKLLKNEQDYQFPEVKSYPKRQILNSFNNSEGSIFVYSKDGLPDDTKEIIHRFSKVFSLTYKRYMDLVHAEKQAREAQIEASLERVRAKAMAMHNSEDISGATAIVFEELTRLGIEMERCGIVILDDTPIQEVWSTLLSPENKKVVDVISGKLDSKMHVMLQEVYKAWMNKKEFFAYTLKGDEVRNYYDKLEKEPGYRFPKVANYPHQQIANCFYFNEGYVFAYTIDELSENEKHVFQRFTSVFSLTYRRYLDLIKAEAQAREATKQASLNRVRGEIASMRNAEDLKRITPVIWRELKELEVPFIRCGVFIINEETERIKAHLSTPAGDALAVLELKFDENKLTKNLVLFRKKNEVYKIHWNKADFIQWMKSMMKSGQVQSAEKYQGSVDAPESLDLHFIPFKQGMLYVGNSSPLKEEELELTNSLAKSFSIAYARYADFKNLEIAKEQIEKTLEELKAAQNQLVHSEKMASLGELTAGIAHEIQNPLNFVNNFSELSNELLDELKEEMDAGNNDEVKALAEDVIQNLKKINHHGKRAESIIKGMLLHSRGSSDEKKPTDINSLCDEYLRLSYHGLRAKDKSFNADFKFIPDEKLPKVNVIPQDIGRVLLNLINNAFHVVQAPPPPKGGIREAQSEYKPLVIVKTSYLHPSEGKREAIEIRVVDNGPGIPEKIKDKIFQPFFTTKPTGEGTGLGLSISYDIVTKGHGGELKFETKEGEGSEFIIQLPVNM